MSLLIDIVKTAQNKPITKVSNELFEKRIKECAACPFLNKTTGSCGTLFMGGTVEYHGEFKELCGCIVKDKATYLNDACPLSKW